MSEKLFFLKYKLFKNVLNFSILEIIAKIIGFVTFVYVARECGPVELGKLSFTQALVSYFIIFNNLGLHNIGLREAIKKTDIKYIYTNIVILKTIVFFISYGLLYILLYYFEIDSYLKEIILIYGLMIFFNPLFVEWIFNYQEDFVKLSIGHLLKNLILFICTFYIIKISNNKKIISYIYLLIIINGIYLLLLFLKFKKYLFIKFIDLNVWKKFFKSGIVLSASSLMIGVYYNIDKIIIKIINGSELLGYYEAAYKIIGISIVPSSLIWTVFSKKIAKKSFKDFKYYIKIMFSVSIGVIVFIYLLSDFLIINFYGSDYFKSIFVLKVLLISVVFIYLNMAIVNPFVLWNLEKQYFLYIVIGAIVNLLLNLLLIPKFNIIGAALSTIFAELCIFLLGINYYKNKKMNIFKND